MTTKKGDNKTPKHVHTEGDAFRYMENAKDLLKNASFEGNSYLDKKPVREAFGTAYLAVLEAINEVLLKKGLTVKQLPQSVDAYRSALRKYLAVNNGKLMREFEILYESLHIAGYYRGLFHNVNAVKEEIKSAERFIHQLLN